MVDEFSVLYDPGEQSRHTVAFMVAEYVPGPQLTHIVDALCDE